MSEGKEAYEKRRDERIARKAHLNDKERQDIDLMDLLDRLVTAIERIALTYDV